LIAIAWLGCGSDDADDADKADHAKADASTSPSTADASTADAGPEARTPLYAIATAVTDDSGSSTYVKVFDRLDAEIDLGTAREFSGWSDMGAIGRYLFVSDGEAPSVYRFQIGDDGALIDDGEIGFGSYVDDANFYNQTLISETKAYLIGNGEYVVWNPTTLRITGTVPFPDVAEREGIVPYVGLDRGAVVRDGRLYHVVGWSDTENLDFLPDSRIVVMDIETDTVVDVIEVPCPDMSTADRDEAGNLYFSNWVYSPGGTLLEHGPKACAVRIPAGSETIDDWRFSYDEVTGHEGAVLGYLGDGQFMFSSFLGDPAAYDPKSDDWFDWLFGDTWQLQTLDPKTLATRPIEGAPKNGGGYAASRFEGLTHVLIPGESYASTTLYGIDADGVAHKETETNGWATRLFKVR
jgi:hypothetical protein